MTTRQARPLLTLGIDPAASSPQTTTIIEHRQDGTLAIVYPTYRRRPAPTNLGRLIRKMSAAWRDAARSFAMALMPAMTKAAVALDKMASWVTAVYNGTREVAGLTARYQVRAGLDPSYADPAALNRLVRSILAGDEGELFGVTPKNRRAVAAAAMRGWAESYGTDRPVLSWHRLIGSTSVVVHRSAA